MPQSFSRITLYSGTARVNKGLEETLFTLTKFLLDKKLNILIEENTANYFKMKGINKTKLHQLGEPGDLIIVVGGDGSLLSAARSAVKVNVPVVGINRGYLGFLTDILPDALEDKITEVLAGEYIEEFRFLLDVALVNGKQISYQGEALNDVILMPGDIPHLIEFSIYIDNNLVCKQRADGLITATPTGSTAYALSGGGPILHPNLDAIVLVPMFPHTLSSRPIVIDGNNIIKIVIDEHNTINARLSCDGHQRIAAQPGDTVIVRKKPQKLRLIHPLDYNYYETLRSKLGWESKHT